MLVCNASMALSVVGLRGCCPVTINCLKTQVTAVSFCCQSSLKRSFIVSGDHGTCSGIGIRAAPDTIMFMNDTQHVGGVFVVSPMVDPSKCPSCMIQIK